ncbi:MAG: hypothetical protein DCF15_21850 [Phormidesmis priestleyi]|uniref:Uncharacterized protein n=1 Tax=Phormidesmis priestleyi TaxID=268141 RepID=A0A2W4WSM1_9CYAN|nr:MAG: hypothetical protein DCF15_21850 [Phormidesmis priestleyi]
MWIGVATAAVALPGQSVQEAEAWMQAHPTLRAEPRERLSIRRNDTPSRRYTFHASVFSPGGASAAGSGGSLLARLNSTEPMMVRSEKFTLVDLISGVSVARLEDALRSLYGAEVYADYRRSQPIRIYSPDQSNSSDTQRSSRAQLSEGDVFAYLIEVMPNPDGTINTGGVTVMLKADVPAFVAALHDSQSREVANREAAQPVSGSIAGPVTEPITGPAAIRQRLNLDRTGQ